MVSVVYSTRKKNDAAFQEFRTKSNNDIEILEYVNDGQYSLSQIYNIGLEEAKYDIVIFAHDDVFLEKGFDDKVLNAFNENKEYGILGVAGGCILDKDAMWWKYKNLLAGSVYHKTGKKKYLTKYSKTFENTILEVATIDGVFIAIDKKRIQQQFDERITGFHFYDIAFCVSNAIQGVKIGVISDLKIYHKSVGKITDTWHQNKHLFLSLYGDKLPIQRSSLKIDKDTVELKEHPNLSVIIPTRNNFELLSKCIQSFLKPEKKYKNLNIFIADTGSENDVLLQTEALINEYDFIHLVKYNYYNFAKINNDVVKNHIDQENTELLLFCNDDIIIVNDAINRMVNTYLNNKDKIGTIGARLLFYNGTVQHGGVSLFENNGKFRLTHTGLNSFYDAGTANEVTIANTGAFLMVSLDNFMKIGMFNEKYTSCLEDVQLGLDLIKDNKVNIYEGSAVCLHKEGSLRKKDSDYSRKIQVDFNKLLPTILEMKNKLKKNNLIRRIG